MDIKSWSYVKASTVLEEGVNKTENKHCENDLTDRVNKTENKHCENDLTNEPNMNCHGLTAVTLFSPLVF